MLKLAKPSSVRPNPPLRATRLDGLIPAYTCESVAGDILGELPKLNIKRLFIS